MPRRLALLVALPLIALSAGAALAKPRPVQRTIQPRAAVHYYRAKPPHRTFTQAPDRPPFFWLNHNADNEDVYCGKNQSGWRAQTSHCSQEDEQISAKIQWIS